MVGDGSVGKTCILMRLTFLFLNYSYIKSFDISYTTD